MQLLQRFLPKFFILCLCAGLTACVSDPPAPTLERINITTSGTATTLPQTLRCVGAQLKSPQSAPATFTFIILSSQDGAIRDDYQGTQFSSAERLQLANILADQTTPAFTVVYNGYPPNIKSVVSRASGSNRFGIPPTEYAAELSKDMAQFVNRYRKPLNLPRVDAVPTLLIDGVFARRNPSNPESDAADVTHHDTLELTIINLQSTELLGNETFAVKHIRDSDTVRLQVTGDDYYHGLGNSELITSVTNTAKRYLLQAGALWLLNETYKDSVDFSACLRLKPKPKPQPEPVLVTPEPAPELSPLPVAAPVPDPPVEEVATPSVKRPVLQSLAKLRAPTPDPAEAPITPVALSTPRAPPPQPPPAPPPAAALPTTHYTFLAPGYNPVVNPYAVNPALVPGLYPQLYPGYNPAAVAGLNPPPNLGLNPGLNPRLNPGLRPASPPFTDPTVVPMVNHEHNITGWRVSAGVFCDAENAVTRIFLLHQRGYDTNTEHVKLKKCKATRIWLGPYRKARQAREVVRTLKSITGELGHPYR